MPLSPEEKAKRMRIDISASDLMRIRRLVAEKHYQIAMYPVVVSPKPGHEGTRLSCIADLEALRKLHGRLTLALRQVHGHDCHPETLERYS